MKKSITWFVVLPIVIFLVIGSCKKDEVAKSCQAAPTVFAGHDTTVANVTSLPLNGISDGAPGTWSITQG